MDEPEAKGTGLGDLS